MCVCVLDIRWYLFFSCSVKCIKRIAIGRLLRDIILCCIFFCCCCCCCILASYMRQVQIGIQTNSMSCTICKKIEKHFVSLVLRRVSQESGSQSLTEILSLHHIFRHAKNISSRKWHQKNKENKVFPAYGKTCERLKSQKKKKNLQPKFWKNLMYSQCSHISL